MRLAGGWLACLLACILVRMVPWPAPIALMLLLITVICVAVFSAAFSVNWYRALLDEEPAPDVVPLSLGSRELRFLAWQSAISLVPGLPLLMFFMLIGADAWWSAALSFANGGSIAVAPTLQLLFGFALSVPASGIAMFILPRLMLVLPAIATDVPGPLLVPLWKLSRGETKPILYGWLACVLPPIGLWAILWFELAGALGGLAAPIVEAIGYICWFAALALGGGFLCNVFKTLTERRPNSADPSGLALHVAAE